MSTTAGALVPDRKATITAAAAELFAAKGFAGAGIDEIGARAGVSGPAIYRHFRGKDAVLLAVVMEAVDAFELSVPESASTVEELASGPVSAALEHPERLVTYLRERHRLGGDALQELDLRERQLFHPWRDAIRKRNPSCSRRRSQGDLALLAAMSVIAIGDSVPRPDLDKLLVASTAAFMLVPPTEPKARREPTGGWTIPPSRRELILAAALRLFRERGYHGVSMDDIGEAVGVTGPTIYFHYKSKGDVLADAHERASIRSAVAVDDAVRRAVSASDALDRLARAQLTVAVDHADLVVVTSREVADVEANDRERFERRAADIIRVWVAVVGELRPELTPAEVRTVALGVFSAMNRIAYGSTSPAMDGARPPWALGSVDVTASAPATWAERACNQPRSLHWLTGGDPPLWPMTERLPSQRLGFLRMPRRTARPHLRR